MNKLIEIPTITELPNICSDAALFIWQHQNRLNAISHPTQTGTIESGSTLSAQVRKELVFDYLLALISEVNELRENWFWKHWSAEAKSGRRWELVNPQAESGEGTVQNVHLEITDIVFFTVSILHLLNFKASDWVSIWGSNELWSKEKGSASVKSSAKEINSLAMDLSTIFGLYPFTTTKEEASKAVTHLVNLCQEAGLTWEMTLKLYSQKLITNYERQIRGRKQVGDAKADIENANIKV